MREQLRLGSRLCWAFAWALAIACPIVFLLWPGSTTWWVAPLLAMPLVLLTMRRAGQMGHVLDDGAGGGGDSGGWAPPDFGGGGGDGG